MTFRVPLAPGRDCSVFGDGGLKASGVLLLPLVPEQILSDKQQNPIMAVNKYSSVLVDSPSLETQGV